MFLRSTKMKHSMLVHSERYPQFLVTAWPNRTHLPTGPGFAPHYPPQTIMRHESTDSPIATVNSITSIESRTGCCASEIRQYVSRYVLSTLSRLSHAPPRLARRPSNSRLIREWLVITCQAVLLTSDMEC